MRVITKLLLSPDSFQLPMLSCPCTVNVFCYWFSSPTLSLLCLFLSFFAFFMKHSISHYFSPSSHRGFCNLLPWLTWAGKWTLQYFMTLTWRSEQIQLTPNCTLNPRANLSQIIFFLSPTSAFLLSLVKTPSMHTSKCNATLKCTFSYPRWFWTAALL